MLAIIFFIFYVCQATQETNNNFLKVKNLEHDQVEVFTLDDVEYLFFGYQVTFDEACIICLNYKGQLAVLSTKEKADFVTKAMSNTLELGEFWIGAQSNKKDLWYWIDKNKKLKLDHTFLGSLRLWDSSELVSNNDNCLTIYRKRHNIPTFVPLQCSKKRPFICERETDKFGIEAKEVDVIKVDKEEYTLYSAKATWAEAVFQCRQKDLQIAEVKSKKAAQAIATSMLRVRPDAMENAWIGGHLKDNVWEWVASNNDIVANELWTNNSKLSTGCLLLDRHLCQDPIYVSAKCDRKRHILCQKPAKQLISKSPVRIEVDDCPYWIGVYPLDWLEARKSCQAINASLVILDSPKIINHMMNLMVDYKQELRHIWTDGYRRKNSTTSGKGTNRDTWYWTSTGNRIPESNFIPWCPVYYDSQNEDCLNLDRENHKTPVVYGLDCRKNQTYVCQPWKGHCVSHRVQEDLLKNSDFLNLYSSLADVKPVKTPAIALSQNSSRETAENVSLVYEDISNMKKSHSTESYYTSSVSYSIPQQVTFLLDETTEPIIQEISLPFRDKEISQDDGKNSDNERELEMLKPTEVIETNSLNLITEFFSPLTLIQFTLPSLPQFGIRVVSAEETNPKSEVKNRFYQNTEESSKNLTFPETLDQMIKPKIKKISLPNLNKTHVSVSPTKEIQNKNDIATFEYLPTTTTTEEMESVSGGLYGENIDYDDALSSRATEVIEKKEPSDNNEFSKSKETLINNMPVNLRQDLNISAILQRVIDEELKLMNQQEEKNESSMSEQKSLTNSYSGSTSEPQNEFENKEIPPYVFEAPLSVELFNDDTDVPAAPIVPALRILDQVDDSEANDEEPQPRIDTASDDFDFESLKIDPYDKDSMLQLGRFLKNMFADQTSNAQTINFNLISRQNLPEETMQTNQIIQRDTKAQNEVEMISTSTSTANSVRYSTENLDSTPCQSSQSFSSAVRPEYLQQPCGQAPILVPLIQLFRAPQMFPEMNVKSSKTEKENENETRNKNEKRNGEEKKNRNEGKNGNVNQRSVNKIARNSQKSLFNVFKDLVKGMRFDIKEEQLRSYLRRFVRERHLNPEKYDFDTKSGTWHKSFKMVLDLLNGTAVRFHGERVQLRIGSFGYKRQPRSQASSGQIGKRPIYKKKAHLTSLTSQPRDEVNVDQISNVNTNSFTQNDDHTSVKNKLSSKRVRQRNKDLKSEVSSRGHKSLKTVNKVVKKSINEENKENEEHEENEENEENPFPDFPIINFETKNAQDSIDNGFDSVRISRAVTNGNIGNILSMVSVYIILKQQNNTLESDASIPFLELHIRMPASSNPENETSEISVKTKNINNDQVHVEKYIPKVEKAQMVKGTETLQKRKAHNQKLSEHKNIKNPNLSYEKNHANDFIKNIFHNMTNSRTIPDLRRKRQLLYLVLKYLKHITDARQKMYSPTGENDNSRYLNMKDGKEKKEILQVSKNGDLRVAQMQTGIYPGIEKRPFFNMIENDLNPRIGVFNSIPNLNYNMRRYDDMPHLSVHPRMLTNPRFRRLFTDYQQELNRN